jgi:Family of unknown function (DUF6527)
MKVKLTDPWFEARFLREVTEKGSRLGGEFQGAQGLFMYCPCAFGKSDVRAHRLRILFANPDGALPAAPGIVPLPRWTVSGSGLADLTLCPSVAVGEPECWHGYITKGDITWRST